MRILIVEDGQPIGLPTLTAYDVVGRSRRSYLVRHKGRTLSIPKSGRYVFTDPEGAIEEYRRRLSQSIRGLEAVRDQIEEAIDLKRSSSIPVLVYDSDGNGVTTMLSTDGTYLSH
jgi:hypothetical protein